MRICWVPSHIDVTGNEAADAAANAAAASRDEAVDQPLPSGDYVPMIKGFIRQKWQLEWTAVVNNKLRVIKDSVRPWASSQQRCRHLEVTLCRLRIGHTLKTHGHLMNNEEQPTCDDCEVPLTVVHILAECPRFLEARWRAFSGRPP